MFIRIGGVPGVGKSTLINYLEGVANEHDIQKVRKVKGGDILMQVLRLNSYAELRAIPEEIREKARPEMFRQMYRMAKLDPRMLFLRDAHYSLFQAGQLTPTIFPLLPDDHECIESMVCITANPEEIYIRRLVDVNNAGRTDRFLDKGQIYNEQELEIKTCAEQASILGLKPVYVENHGEISKIAHRLVLESFPDGEPKEAMLRALVAEGNIFNIEGRQSSL